MRNTIYSLMRAVRIALLFSVCPIVAGAQQIQTVKILSQNELPEDKILYVLEITGKGFGRSGHTRAEVRPREGIVSGPSTVSGTDKVMVVSFQATKIYVPSSTAVMVNGKEVASFELGSQNPPDRPIQSYRSILDPKTVADIFGRRMAKRFIVLQVTVANRSRDYQYLIHDVSIDLKDLFPDQCTGGRRPANFHRRKSVFSEVSWKRAGFWTPGTLLFTGSRAWAVSVLDC